MKFCVDTYYISLYFDASDRVTPTFPRNRAGPSKEEVSPIMH